MTHETSHFDSNEKGVVPEISCSDLKQLQKSGETFFLIDVREKGEWDAGHIEGATLIPQGILQEKIAEYAPDKTMNIIVHCAYGGRATACVKTLLGMGYTHVKNLKGGYTEYRQTADAGE
ncbi:MAG: rhodanese-like domain-containing protein [bacterium]|nr:rhodanese-like domain-containing protein [bacterium]